jgi:ATP-dependent DNA helicase RecG
VENIIAIHFPTSLEDWNRARAELGYEELYHFQRRGLEKKYALERDSLGLAPTLALDTELMKSLIESLPFPLTNKQKIVLFQILKDMERPHAMARMLQGDVGTGKTVVAMLAAVHAILVARKKEENLQVAIMAPTEILARQHFTGQEAWLMQWGIRSDLLVGSLTPRMKEDARARLRS